MGSEVLPSAKGFPTFIAVIKPCYTANSLMGKETESVAKKFSTLAAFIRPFLSVNFLVLNKVKFLGASFPMFAELTKPFTSEDSLMPNKYVYVAGDYLDFFPALMTFSTVKNSFTLLIVVLFLPGTSVLLLKFHAGHKVVRYLHFGREIFSSMHHAALQKCGAAHTKLEGFLFNVLHLVLLNVCSEKELFPTCPTCICFLSTIINISLLFSQMWNVSQNWGTYLTGLDILRRWTYPGSANLWHSCRFALFRRCISILGSTPKTWKHRRDGQVLVHFIGGNDTQLYMTHERSSPQNCVQDMKLESNWGTNESTSRQSPLKQLTSLSFPVKKKKSLLPHPACCLWTMVGVSLQDLALGKIPCPLNHCCLWALWSWSWATVRFFNLCMHSVASVVSDSLQPYEL